MTARNEPMRGVMDAVCEVGVHTIVCMMSSQVGKTELLLNVIGFFIDQDPSPILHLQPTLEMGEAFSKDRLRPMLRDTPVLRDAVRDPRERDSGNTLLHKTFPGGHITIAGSNSPASLASRPIRVVLADEIDRYPISAGIEGDPVYIVRRRTANFWNRIIVLTSTPTIKGVSRIEAEFETGDKRYFMVPCHDCGEHQRLVWSQVQWTNADPWTANYVCAHCGSVWKDVSRWRNVRHGYWEATAPFHGIASFHLSAIYSPWTKLGEMAASFVQAKKTVETLKTWINTWLGESFEEDAERIDAKRLATRLEAWGDPELESKAWPCPNEVLVITCGVDIQDDRAEIERVGWGIDEESWSLDHSILYGDPSTPDFWKRLDDYLLTPTERIDGQRLPVHGACIDSGGHHTQAVYRFVKDKLRRFVYAVKGVSGEGKPLWPKRSTKNNMGKINLFLIGVDAGKDTIYSRLKISHPGPAFCHFPIDREMTYFDQMTAEEVQTKYVKGFPHRFYFLPGGRRNEALDLRVYAYASLLSLNVRWGHISEQDARRKRGVVKPTRKDPALSRSEPVEQSTFEPLGDAPTMVPVAPRVPTLGQKMPMRQRVMRRSKWMG